MLCEELRFKPATLDLQPDMLPAVFQFYAFNTLFIHYYYLFLSLFICLKVLEQKKYPLFDFAMFMHVDCDYN